MKKVILRSCVNVIPKGLDHLTSGIDSFRFSSYINLKNGADYAIEMCRWADVCKMVFAHYLKKYLMYPHQICYTETPWQSKDHIQTG